MNSLTDILTAETPAGRWLAGTAIVVLGFIMLRAALGVVGKRVSSYAARRSSAALLLVAELIRRTKTPFLIALAVAAALAVVALPSRASGVLHMVIVAAIVVQAALWLTTISSSAIRMWFLADGRLEPEEITIINTVSFIASIIVWAVSMLFLLQNLGIDVTALIAGLGVGGIAVALAVQRVLGDLLASLSIVIDKPFVVGDFVVVGELMGSVEHIGLKTTRIRSLSGEQIVMSNADLLASRIRNYKRMTERRVQFNVGVVYGTPKAKLERIPAMIRAAIEAEPTVRFDRAHFAKLGDWSLGFEAVYYVLSPDYVVHMDAQQRIYLRIFESFAAAGVDFAFPTQMLHLDRRPAAPARERMEASV